MEANTGYATDGAINRPYLVICNHCEGKVLFYVENKKRLREVLGWHDWRLSSGWWVCGPRYKEKGY